MTAAKAIEYRISQQLMRRREGAQNMTAFPHLAERLITVVAATVVLAAIGSYLPELLWVLVGAVSIFAIGTK